MGGDPHPTSTQESTAAVIDAYTKGLPGLMQAYNTQIGPNELAQLASSQATSPAYAKLQADIYGTTGKDLNRIGNEISDENALASTKRDLATYAGGGKDLIKQVSEAQAVADPEFYKNKMLLGQNLEKLLNTGGTLNEGELSQIERGLNRLGQYSGNANAPSASNVAANALTFGQAGANKFNTALQLATAALPALKSGIDANQVATGKQSIANTGDQKFIGATQGAGNQVAGQSTGLLGAATQSENNRANIEASRRSGWDRTLGAIQSATASFGNLASAFKPGG